MNGKNNSNSEDPTKRLAILEQAILTFAEQGFRDADVQVIADRAGVGKGTVYRYFGNKKDLFWAATFEVMLRLEREVFDAMDRVDGIYAKLRTAGMAYMMFFEANPEYLEVFVQDRAEFRGAVPDQHREHHVTMIQRVEKVLQKSIEAGELRPIDTHKLTATFGNMLYGTAVLGSHLSPLPPGEIAEYAIDVLLQGILVDYPDHSGSTVK